ncbi:MAG: hypothetical protein IT328_23835 [Caldilineaceae bacterium]|nr:hypothetical protein [Caldilineaceae bacterium]
MDEGHPENHTFFLSVLLYFSYMPESERKFSIPSWAELERRQDMAWLNGNLHHFWPMAQSGYEEVGRGALVSDMVIEPQNGIRPIVYCPQELIVALGDHDAIRMVAQYEPEWQFVAMLLKAEKRVSTYRIGVYER